MDELDCETQVLTLFRDILDNRLPFIANDADVMNLSERDQTVFYVQYFDTEVLNGGFDQWVRNPTGGFVAETLAAMERVGAMATAKLIRNLCELFPRGEIPRDYAERSQRLDSLTAEQKGFVTELGDKYGGEGGREGGQIFKKLVSYINSLPRQ